MADIELVIKIPEGLKKDFESERWTALSCMEMKNALENGTPLPKGHGRLIDESKITTVYGHEEERVIIDYTDAPTILESDKEE